MTQTDRQTDTHTFTVTLSMFCSNRHQKTNERKRIEHVWAELREL